MTYNPLDYWGNNVGEKRKVKLSYDNTANNNLSLSVHENGTTFITLHNAEKIELRERENEMILDLYCEGKMVNIIIFKKEEKNED